MEGGSKKNTEKENKYAGPLMASLENTLGDLMLDGEDGADSKSPNERLLQLGMFFFGHKSMSIWGRF